MVKVRLSQIEEGNGKPMYTRKHKGTTKKKPLIGDIDEDDEEDSDDDFNDNEDEGKKRLSKTMLHFKDEGITISAWDLHTIETDMRFVEKPKAHWEFGITINKGLNPSQFINKTDLSMWYLSEEVRDDKMSKMLEILKAEGLNVIDI